MIGILLLTPFTANLERKNEREEHHEREEERERESCEHTRTRGGVYYYQRTSEAARKQRTS